MKFCEISRIKSYSCFGLRSHQSFPNRMIFFSPFFFTISAGQKDTTLISRKLRPKFFSYFFLFYFILFHLSYTSHTSLLCFHTLKQCVSLLSYFCILCNCISINSNAIAMFSCSRDNHFTFSTLLYIPNLSLSLL